MNSTPLSLNRLQRATLIAARFVTAISLSLWIGGMAFFGIMAAPVLFHPEKSGIARLSSTAVMAPQMVSAMLTRFGTLTNILGVLLILSVLVDGFLSRATKNQMWRGQAMVSIICLGFSLFLNTSLLPQTRREQTEILPIIARAARGETLTPQEKIRRNAFDKGHNGYQRFATINLYLLVALLFLLIARGTPASLSAVPKGEPKL